MDMATILTGRGSAPAPRVLRAGPVLVDLDGADLRSVRVGDTELVQRVYMAVRDAPWNTIPGAFSDWSVEEDDESFLVTFTARHAHEAIDLRWAGRIEGAPDGTIRYEMDAVCHGVFEYAKIGFNVHHALDGSVGHRYRIVDEDGRTSDGVLPEAIEPQRIVDGKLSGMFEPYRQISIEVRDALEAVVSLEGDLLELQDHRNWADANFKSYGTPLSLGFPFTSTDGARLRQVLTIGYRGTVRPAPAPGLVRIEVGSALGPLPAIGLGQASHGRPLTTREARLVRSARPAHLRVDLVASDPASLDDLERAIGDARAVEAPLELAVHANDADAPGLAAIAERLAAAGLGVARVLVYQRLEGYSAMSGCTPGPVVALVREHLEPVTGPVPFAGGTNQAFSDINRDRPSDAALTGLCFSLCPTVHAADDRSIVENVRGAAEVVRMGETFAAGRPISVSPVTLATRNGPYPAGPALSGALPPAVDVRQASLLGAAWTAAALGRLAEAGAASVTWYETSGWRGIVERDEGSPHAAFPSRPGQAFPLYHVLADAGEWATGTVRRTRSSAPLLAQTLAVEGGDGHGIHVLVANLQPRPVVVELDGVPGTEAALRFLDATTADAATADPAGWRAAEATTTAAPVRGGRLQLELDSYAVARVDARG
jgi:D-apionolactonase